MKNKIIITLHEPSKEDMVLAVSTLNWFLSALKFTNPHISAQLTSTMDINGTIKERSVLYEAPSVIDFELEYSAYCKPKSEHKKAN